MSDIFGHGGQTHNDTVDKERIEPNIVPSNSFIDTMALVAGELDSPCCDVNGGDEPDDPSGPAMEKGELVKVHLGGKRKGKDGEWGGLEGEQDAQGKEGKCDDAGATAGCPPCLGDRVLWLAGGGGRGNRSTALELTHSVHNVAPAEDRRGEIGLEIPETSIRRNVVGANTAQEGRCNKQQGQCDELGIRGKR